MTNLLKDFLADRKQSLAELRHDCLGLRKRALADIGTVDPKSSTYAILQEIIEKMDDIIRSIPTTRGPD